LWRPIQAAAVASLVPVQAATTAAFGLGFVALAFGGGGGISKSGCFCSALLLFDKPCGGFGFGLGLYRLAAASLRLCLLSKYTTKAAAACSCYGFGLGLLRLCVSPWRLLCFVLGITKQPRRIIIKKTGL